jgi:hypothetical protein
MGKNQGNWQRTEKNIPQTVILQLLRLDPRGGIP